MSENKGPAERLDATYWLSKMESKRNPSKPKGKWGTNLIKGTLSLLDSDNKICYTKIYYSKKQREQIIEGIIRYYRLQERPFTLQIAPYCYED